MILGWRVGGPYHLSPNAAEPQSKSPVGAVSHGMATCCLPSANCGQRRRSAFSGQQTAFSTQRQGAAAMVTSGSYRLRLGQGGRQPPAAPRRHRRHQLLRGNGRPRSLRSGARDDLAASQPAAVTIAAFHCDAEGPGWSLFADSRHLIADAGPERCRCDSVDRGRARGP